MQCQLRAPRRLHLGLLHLHVVAGDREGPVLAPSTTDDLFDPEVAGAYRDKVLAPGGRRDAADLVEDFLGRPYTFDAYAAWLAE